MDRTSRASGYLWKDLAASSLLLAVVIAPAAMAIAWLGSGQLNATTLRVAGVAGIICWVAAAAALSITVLSTLGGLPVQGVLAAMAIRMGLPLVAMITLPSLGGGRALPGLGAVILGVYLLTLVVETLLSLRIRPGAAAASSAGPPA